jgi:integrase
MKPIKWKDGYKMAVQRDGFRKYFYGATPKECKLKYEQWNGTFSSAPVAFSIAFDAWMKDYVSSLSKATQSQYKTLADSYIIPLIGNIRIDKLMPFNCQLVLTHARKKDESKLSETTLKHIRKIMHVFLEYQRTMKKTIKENPCNGITIPKVPKTRARRSATLEEITRLWDRMQGTHYYYCFQWLLVTGMRPSEACGLKYSDIKSGHIKIFETRSKMDVSDGKSKNANRTIELTPAMTEIINLNKAYLKAKNIEVEYLFPTRDGEPSNAGYLTRAWGRLMQGTGIKLTLYEIRHTYISLMIDKLPLKELQQMVGHSSSFNTSTVYAHIFKKQSNNAEIIDSTMTDYLQKKPKIKRSKIKSGVNVG